ncbi:MAG TPA: helix-turn-helix transcriptional regulator [Nocardioides sp.]|uniref:helix-turn-helix transcriptional regulator n=1 Tax=Nocardioides sp. TaxID=35761 RepID=UPI002CD5D6C9|nr:helix-turn-helix transcriptional regulator [Nocardioides sp.]HTW18454.1 helix-turn-helix transcriptional regulator [Nocardioides sp.]
MDEAHRIEIVRHRASPALDGVIAGMVGMSERAPAPVRRRQPAGTVVPLVLSFGEPLAVDALGDGVGAGREYRSFAAGLSTGRADTRFSRGQDCVQVYLTPLGVRRVLGVPGREVARSVVHAGDVVGELGDALSDRLGEAISWTERFGIVEDLLLRRAAEEAAPPSWLSWMWDRIQRSGGRTRIADLVAATGWSHGHVVRTFREEVGLTPKEIAGVVRFERAVADLGVVPQAELAARHGYADQSHLIREVRRYAGETPRELAAARRPTPATALRGS